MTHAANNRSLDEVIDELFYSSGEMSPEIVKDYVNRYPQFERELLDFAVHWAASVPLDDSCLSEEGMSGESLLSLQSRVLKRLYEVDQSTSGQTKTLSDAQMALAAIKGAKALGAVSEALGIGDHRILVTKILNGTISNPPRFVLAQLADYLQKPIEAIALALQSHQRLSYSFKASKKPVAPGQETWGDAVARLNANPNEKKRLLRMSEEELGK
jgi:hypothetical protein